MPSTHEDWNRSHSTPEPSPRAFGLTMAGAFLAFALGPAMLGRQVAFWWLAAAALFFAAALLAPSALVPLNRIWLRFGLLLHSIVSPAVLAFLFYAVVTPFAAAMRLLGKKPLALGFDPDAATYWTPRVPPGPAPDSLKNQF